jgi:hypothetical protein
MSEYICPIAGKPCYYWSGTSGTLSTGEHCCHYLLWENHMRKKGKNGKCLSWTKEKKHKANMRRDWPVFKNENGSTHDGYKKGWNT